MIINLLIFCHSYFYGFVAELAYAADLKSAGLYDLVGSIPTRATNKWRKSMDVYVLMMVLDTDTTIDIFADEESAKAEAIECVKRELNNDEWDSKACTDHYEIYTRIHDCFSKGDIYEGLSIWNYEASALSQIEDHRFVDVVKKEVKTSSTFTSSIIVEKSCKVCGKKNYTDVQECWCCGNNPW